MIRLTPLVSFTNTLCSETHFEKPASIRKLSILLFQALGAYFKPYKVFLNQYTFNCCPLISNPGG